MTDDSPEQIPPKDSSDEEVSRGTGLLAQPEERESGNYLDFEIEIGRGSGRQYPLAVIHSPAGEARETLNFPFDEIALETRLKNLEIALLRSGGARRQVLSPEEQSVQDFGLQLFASLFSGEARTRYDMSSDIARQRGLGLRLKLRIQAPELARLPWEFLYDPRQGEYVCMSRDTPIVRYIELPQPIKPLTVKPPLRILGMISSPSNLPRLDVQREKLRVEKAIASLQSENLVRLTWLASATWRELQRAMRSGPWHIFHFIGHGGFDASADEGVIALDDESGTAQLLLATELGRLLADHRSLRLALLNACDGARGSQHDIFSSSAAVLVRRGLPAVLAMQYAITDRAAIEFSRSFYEALADGLPVDAAVCEARKAVSLSITNTIEWGTPVLYMRSPQGVIFELPPQAHREHSAEQSTSIADKEEQAQIDRLYTEGRAAFWVEDWDRACARFQSILNLRSDYPDAAAALEEAHQNRQRAALYAHALVAQQAEKWDESVSALQELTKQSPDYKDAVMLLQTACKKKQLTDLYEEAHKLHAAKQWQAVVRVFEQIHILQADFPDPDEILPSAEKEVAEFNRQAELEVIYSQSIRAMDAGGWPEALNLLEKVQADEPGYRDVESLLKRSQGEVEKAQKNRQVQEQINRLYEQAHGLARARQWHKALDKLDEIRALDEAFADPDRLTDKAKSVLEHEEQEAQRQSELSAMYAESVQLLKDEQCHSALKKWSEIHAWDPKFPDRQKVQQTAKKKLAELGKPKTTRPALWTRIPWRRVVQVALLVIVLAVLGIAIAQSQPPAAYDNFNDNKFDGGYNHVKWLERGNSQNGSSYQENDILIMRQTGERVERALYATKKVKIENSQVAIDFNLKINPSVSNFVILSLENDFLHIGCGIHGMQDEWIMHCWYPDYDAERGISIKMGQWHHHRILIDPATKTFTFYIDGELHDRYTYRGAQSLKFSQFDLALKVSSHTENQEVIGYFDNIRIETIDE